MLSQDYTYAHAAAKFAGVEIQTTLINTQEIAKGLIENYGSIPVLVTEEGAINGTTAIAKHL